jgi:pimeloyl-ACP methyl ester carboxylesterase
VKRWIAALALFLLATAIILRQPVATHAKTLLFVAEVFPQVPVKPAALIADAPEHREVRLASDSGTVVGDLYVPRPRLGLWDEPRKPAVIIALGLKLEKDEDKQTVQQFARGLAKLGHNVLWPRLEAIDQGAWMFERPETFVRAFEHLSRQDTVDPKRISFVGFSIGSSIALVAAADPRIAPDVRAFVFFGGYHDILDYLLSLANEKAYLGDEESPWRPSENGLRQAKELATAEGIERLAPYFGPEPLESRQALRNLLSAPEIERLQSLSPNRNLPNLRTRMFILHDKRDEYVPYTESMALARALPPEVSKTVLIPELFRHVQVADGLSPESLGQLLQLYRFLYAVFAYL